LNEGVDAQLDERATDSERRYSQAIPIMSE
jgi:hypothetical protein